MRLFWFTVLALVATSVSGNEVYRSFAADGTVVYSDRPHGAESEPIQIVGQLTARARDAAAQQPQQPAAPPGARSEPLVAEIEREPTAEELRELRAQNCTVARERNLTYAASRRLYRSLPDGEREYLSDAEIDAARAQAAADVETWCD